MALQSHQRLASVASVDIASSSIMAFRSGTAAINRLVADLHLLEREAEKAGAFTVRSTGDGLLAVFGSPADAVRFARALQARADRLNRSRQRALPLHLRIGITTGEVTEVRAGDLGASEEVVGMPVTLAAKLSSRAESSEILIDAATWSFVSGRAQAAKREVQVPHLGRVTVFSLANGAGAGGVTRPNAAG